MASRRIFDEKTAEDRFSILEGYTQVPENSKFLRFLFSLEKNRNFKKK